MPCNRRRFLQSMAVTGAGLCLPTLGWAGFDPLWKPGTLCANPIDVTVFEMFKIGPGPSSSHTIAPMAAGNDFIGLCAKLPQEQLAVADAIKADEDLEIYTSGANNIFRYPELADQSKASELINAFEEKQQLGGLIQESLADEGSTGIQVYIGDETPVQGMKDCSVVTATYELGEGMKGTIGIIGPKRMDYDKVIGTLRTVQNQLDDLYSKE